MGSQLGLALVSMQLKTTGTTLSCLCLRTENCALTKRKHGSQTMGSQPEAKHLRLVSGWDVDHKIQVFEFKLKVAGPALACLCSHWQYMADWLRSHSPAKQKGTSPPRVWLWWATSKSWVLTQFSFIVADDQNFLLFWTNWSSLRMNSTQPARHVASLSCTRNKPNSQTVLQKRWFGLHVVQAQEEKGFRFQGKEAAHVHVRVSPCHLLQTWCFATLHQLIPGTTGEDVRVEACSFLVPVPCTADPARRVSSSQGYRKPVGSSLCVLMSQRQELTVV